MAMTRVGEHREILVARAHLLARATVAALALLGLGYFFVQVMGGAAYRELAENNRLRRLTIEAPRGIIEDRHGRVLVENLPAYSLELDRTRSRDLGESLRFAAEVLGVPRDELAGVLARQRQTGYFQTALLAEDLSLPEVARFRVARLEHPEFEIEVTQRRFYRLGEHAAHVLGYLGEVSRDELAAEPGALRSGDWVGRRGVERAYDRRLRGEDGERVVVVDSRGVPVEEFGRRLGRPGRRLQLTLDAGLQQEAERLLAGQVGAIVALDPRDGAVRALVSAPAYDPNLFARKLALDDWRALVSHPRHPLQNRALQSAYSPGSVFKIVMGVAALAEGVVTPSSRVHCPGFATHYGRRFHCWKRGGHGSVDLEAAIEGSCDVYFYAVGRELGIERIAEHARRFELGRPTGIDLGGERSGLVPDDEWSRRRRGHPWYPGETISVAIGQGALLTTPIQVATMVAAVANGGFHVTPHVVAGAAPAPRPLVGLAPGLLVPVRSGLERVVNGERGTARGARVPGVTVAGKTGTVQVISHEAYADTSEAPWHLRNHAWFAAYAPAERPELVVVVFVEHGGMGSRAAAPIAKALYAYLFGTDSALVAAAS
jgi:penicillin-binding protein 2